MAKGRHASSPGSFYRDLGIMVLGILLVGAAVFFLLYILVGNDPGSDVTSTSAPVAVETSTSESGATTTTTPTTSTSTTEAPGTSTTIPVRPPSEVTVAVLNSVGLPGAAGAMTSVLVEAGYQTLQASDYEPLQDPSRIWYRDGFSAEANVMLQFLPDATVEPLPDDSLKPGADVVMVLGAGYEG